MTTVPETMPAAVYPPTAMKAAWPMENWPVKPLTIVRETARATLMPMSRRILA